MLFHTRLLHLLGILALAVASANAAITPTQTSITGLGNGIVGLVYPPQTGTSPNPNIKFFSNNTAASENKIWSATGVPPGLTFNPSGILSGKPSKAGNFTMNLSVRVGKQVRDTGIRTIVVVDTLPPIITPSTLPGGKLDNPYQANTPNNGFKLSGTGGTPFGPNSQYPTGYYWQLIPGKLASQRLPQGMTLNPNGVISGTPVWPRPPVPSTSQTYTLQVRATDFLGKSATANFTLVIAPPQGPEIITDCPLPSGLEKYPYPVVQLKARYGKEPYRWPKPAGLPPGLVWNERGYISGTPTTRGTYPITLQVIDANGLSANKSCEIVIRPAPEIVVKPLFLCARVGDTRFEEIEALGGDPPFTWAATGLPPGLTIQFSNSTKAKICGNFTQNGTFTINVTATDTVGRQDTELFPAIIVKPALEITTTSPSPFGIKGNSYPKKTGTPTVTINATGGWPPYTWSWKDLDPEPPPGLTLNKSTGAITGVPTKIGNYTFTIRVQDSCTTPGKSVEKQFKINVYDPLEIKDLQIIQCLTINTTISPPFCLTATGGLPGYEWSIESGSLPAGLTLSSNGCITGTITEGGSFSVTIKVKDQNEIETLKSFSFFVYDELIITSACPLTFGTNGTAYSANLAAIGGNPPYIWSVPTPSTLPLGLNINPNTGTISGTPKVTGNFTFNYRVTDSCGNTATKNCSISIFEPLKILDQSILSCLTTNRSVNPPFCLSPSGGLAPYEWSIVSGRLPIGLSFSSNGCISGNITESGSFPVSIKLKDQNGTEIQKTFSFTISNPLEITSACLPSEWTSGTPISPLTLSANGGSGNLTWSRHDIASKPWPTGLNIVGNKIQGTPIVSNTTNYTIAYQASDACGYTANKTCSITIYPPLTCNKTQTLPCFAIKPFTLQIVADNDFALFSGNNSSISRIIYQNNSTWGSQVSAASSVNFDLQANEDSFYVFAMNAGGPGDISGKIGATNIADLVENNKIKKSQDVSAFLNSYLASSGPTGPIEGGTYNVTLAEAQNARNQLPESSWANPSINSSNTVITQNPYAYSSKQGRNIGFDLTSYNAVFFKFSGVDLSTFPDTVISTVSGGKPPYSWDLLPVGNSGKILPTGMDYEFSSNGTQLILKGTVKESGTFSFITRVTDSLGNTCSQNHTLTVNPKLEASETCNLPSAKSGVIYSANLPASGGANPLTWSWVASPGSSLPLGLTLNSTSGEISGTPQLTNNMTQFTSNFSYTVSDSCSQVLTKNCSIVVYNCQQSGKSGGAGVTNNIHSVQPELGEFTLSYNAQGIPDKFTITAGNNTSTTGVKVSYTGTLKVCKPSGVGNVTVTVEGDDNRTVWNYTLLCPPSQECGYLEKSKGLIVQQKNHKVTNCEGNITFDYNALSGPHKFKVVGNTTTGNQTTYIDTPFLVGKGSFIFYKTQNVVSINVTVTANSSNTIGWTYNLGCPESIPQVSSSISPPIVSSSLSYQLAVPAALSNALHSLNYNSTSLVAATPLSSLVPQNNLIKNAPFKICNFEVTNQLYAAFLNATAKTDSNNLYNTSMQSIGINRNGSSGNFTYSIDSGRENYPVAFVSWYDVARYANWLANGKPNAPQSSATTENGVYNLTSTTIVRNSINPNTGAAPKFWLLNESEWYTSAYLKTDGSALWTYPTQSNNAPDSSGSTPSNFANFGGIFGETTPVGFFDQSPGPFGTFDQAGNVREWTETLDTSSGAPLRIIRGGSWADPDNAMRADESHIADPTLEDDKTGFRIGGAP